jgi:hypothetical protein
MKKLSFLVLLLIPFIFVSCLPDEDTPGDGEETDYAAKFLGTWHVYEADKRLNYDVTIERYSNSETEIVLKNFADLGTVKGDCYEESVLIDDQQIDENYSIQDASGHYVNSKKLTFQYTLSDGIDLETRTATFSR